MLRREFISTTAWKRRLASALVALVSEASGSGSGGGPVPGPEPPASAAHAAHFLTRATLGPSDEDNQEISVIGDTA